MSAQVTAYKIYKMDIRAYEEKAVMGEMAAAYCTGIINKTIREKNRARVVLTTGASQFCFLDSLIQMSVPWDKVTCFHLDEYIGLPSTHPAIFGSFGIAIMSLYNRD